MTTPKPEDIKGFPTDKNAHLTEVHGITYVVTYSYGEPNEKGRRKKTTTTLGRVHEGVFYTMEEYHRLFRRGGELRVKPPEGTSRKYVRKKPLSEHGQRGKGNGDLPARADIQNFPDDPHVSVRRSHGHLYAVERIWYREGGKSKEKIRYLGRVVDRVYYPMEEYHRLFTRQGTLRQEPKED